MKNQPTQLLFEIGTEEIPSGYFEQAKASVLAKAPKLLSECGYEFGQVSVYMTPRRIVIHASDFRSLGTVYEEKTGPLYSIAFQDGLPTQAFHGFMKSVGVKESDIFKKETPRGPCLCVKIRRQYKPLRHFFETLPRQIEFPKLMRWEASRYLFTRPIRWTFAFVGNQKQAFSIGDVKASNTTRGHRFLANRTLTVRSADLASYEKLLKANHVVLNAETRAQKVRELLKSTHNTNEELVHTVANLAEEPFAIPGTFPKEYLKLPKEVLEVSMAKQLKVFACYDNAGKLTNRFVAIVNGPRADKVLIAKDYERVLCSRLEDARFFVQEDAKCKLEAKCARLGDMAFLGSLGSYLEKTKRLEQITRWIGEKANVNHQAIDRAVRAANLSKADLVTHLVYEFPELQGVAGRQYAIRNGEVREVADAILGHYFPRNLAENYEHLRKELNVEGALVGLSDRIDLLVGAFGLGIEPTGSEDPYGLRRAAGGIVKIIRSHTLRFSLRELIETAHRAYGQKISVSVEDLVRKLRPFLKERVVFELGVKTGARESEILQAVLASRFDDVMDVYERFDQLVSVSADKGFLSACKVMERTGNILKGVKGDVVGAVNPTGFSEELEKKLFEILTRQSNEIRQLIEKRHYGSAAVLYGNSFQETLHEFFDKVKVNADDATVRVNRQALMREIFKLFSENVADLSRLTNLS